MSKKIEKMINKVIRALKNLIKEFRQVKWPTPKTAVNLTIFVIILSAIITLLIMGFDALFYTFISKLIN